nr:MAG TPA: hypothetical protein [Caudoviricetes sp.]
MSQVNKVFVKKGWKILNNSNLFLAYNLESL